MSDSTCTACTSGSYHYCLYCKQNLYKYNQIQISKNYLHHAFDKMNQEQVPFMKKKQMTDRTKMWRLINFFARFEEKKNIKKIPFVV